MTQLRFLWSRVPRKLRICLFLLLSGVLTFLIYMFLGFPSFSAQEQFRRAEKEALVGPSTILGTIQGINGTQIMLGETAEGVVFFTYAPDEWEDGVLVYRKKAGDMTLLPAPVTGGPSKALPLIFTSGISVDILPMILFDGIPEATRAELELSVDFPYFQRDFHLEATRQGQGYFAFHLTKSGGSKWQTDPLVAFALQYYNYRSELISQPATVRLYGESGELLCQQELTICNRNGNPKTS